MLLEEILDSAADIICLQEVNRYGMLLRCRVVAAMGMWPFSPSALLRVKPGGCRGLFQAPPAEGGLHRRVLAESLLAGGAVWLSLRWLLPLLQDFPL